MIDLNSVTIADDESHHLLDGKPLYAARFNQVLKFHPPGLAPVIGEEGAFHINLQGHPVYQARFRRTFGFYNGRAAVVTDDGWCHILPECSMVYAQHYAWCGNYQEGRCPVRTIEGDYFHIGLDGLPIYRERWKYAGDYCDGTAVVQHENGQSTHIDLNGAFVHGHWFIDLDIFHKGFARARDDKGWTHVNRQGIPLYQPRFSAVEPFYNGHSRVERLDGGLEIIDERGVKILELREGKEL